MSFATSVEEINSVQRRIKVALPSDLVSKAFDDAYKNVQRKAKLQGFRPGKAPLSVIKKFYGDSVRGEVGETLINKHLFEILAEKNIKPIASPVLESAEVPSIEKEFHFSAVVDIMPQIVLSNWKGLKLTVEKTEVNETQVTKEVDFLKRRHAKTRNAEEGVRAAAGHLASIGHKVFKDGALIENMDVEEFPVALGHNEIFKDLEDAILGMTVGETKKTTITLPENYNDPKLAGQPVEFEITLKNLQDLTLPEANDDFAKDVGYDSYQILVDEIRAQLNTRSEQARRQKLETSVVDELRKNHSFDVPPSLVDQVIDSMIMELNSVGEKERQQLLKDEALRKSFRDVAKIKAQNTLLLWQVAQDEKIQVTDQDVRNHVMKMLPGSDTWEDKKVDDFVKQVRPRVEQNIVFDLALDRVLSNAQITEK